MNNSSKIVADFKFLEPYLGWLAVSSVFTFVLSLVLIPWVISRLSKDCFLRIHLNDKVSSPPTVGSILLVIFRHCLGIILLLAGLAMLFLPGQGLLTIFLGVLLISFPGKRKFILFLVFRPEVQHSLNWLRKKSGKPPFLWPKRPYDGEVH